MYLCFYLDEYFCVNIFKSLKPFLFLILIHRYKEDISSLYNYKLLIFRKGLRISLDLSFVRVGLIFF